jgi:hypothetical protein
MYGREGFAEADLPAFLTVGLDDSRSRTLKIMMFGAA